MAHYLTSFTIKLIMLEFLQRKIYTRISIFCYSGNHKKKIYPGLSFIARNILTPLVFTVVQSLFLI